MLTKLNHPVFSQIELTNKDLVVHYTDGEKKHLLDGATHLAVAVSGEIVHIVAFLKGDFAWHYHGKKEFNQERVELGEIYGGGGKLVTDGLGGLHLFYFTKQSAGFSSLLRHSIYKKEWFGPLLVTANISADDSGFSASWHKDQYLHIVYRGYRQGHLYYRAFDLEQRIWSGAAPLSDTPGHHPQLVPAEDLHLFWQEEHTVLKVRIKSDTWGKTLRISVNGAHVSHVGYGRNDFWSVFWSQGTKFYEALFGSWDQPLSRQRELYDYTWAVLPADGGGVLTLPVFQLKEREETPPAKETPPKKEIPQPKKEPSAQDEEIAKREAKLQTALIEEAFRTLQEWEEVKRSLQRWQASFKPPKPVDIAPLTTKLQGLERNLALIKQRQAGQRSALEKEQERLEAALGRLSKRLSDLELAENKRKESLWRRVLGRL